MQFCFTGKKHGFVSSVYSKSKVGFLIQSLLPLLLLLGSGVGKKQNMLFSQHDTSLMHPVKNRCEPKWKPSCTEDTCIFQVTKITLVACKTDDKSISGPWLSQFSSSYKDSKRRADEKGQQIHNYADH